MDEERKRVLGIIAGILVARHLKTTEELSETPNSTHREPGGVGGSVGGADYAEGRFGHIREITLVGEPQSLIPGLNENG